MSKLQAPNRLGVSVIVRWSCLCANHMILIAQRGSGTRVECECGVWAVTWSNTGDPVVEGPTPVQD